MQKIFGLTANTPSGYLNDAANYSNATPSGMTGTSQQGNTFTNAASPTGGFGTGIAQDLSDLFQPGVIPSSIPGLNLSASGYVYSRSTHGDTQTVKVTNTLGTAITNPVYLVVSNLSSNTTITNATGTTTNNYAGSPYFLVSSGGLAAGASASVTVQYTAPTSGTITSTMAAINTASAP
jgi:hypothetical protein